MEILRQQSETREDLGLLAVMDALEKGDRASQRDLARQTGLNLKKVNFCLHKLLEKGYVKFQTVRSNPDKRAYLYILTPAGFKAKSHLTYRFLKFTLGFYGMMEEKVTSCLRQMAKAGINQVLLCGASDVVRIVALIADSVPVKVVGVRMLNGSPPDFDGIRGVEALDEVDWDGLLITALEDVDAVEQGLRDEGVPSLKIWRLS